jgi:hypothetical protein
MYKLIPLIAFITLCVYNSSAQMPPPGYERAKKIQDERNKLARMDRDSVTLIDTIAIFDPETYEQEIRIVSSRISLRDYCTRYLGIGKPEMLEDGNPHTIIDPKTYEELTIRLNPTGKIDTIPK